MPRIEETPLPGVGVRYSFTTRDGRQVSVVHHRTGHRELYVSSREDPDRSTAVLDLDDEEARTLAELLGGSQVVSDLERLQDVVPGMALDWVTVEADSPAAGRSIGQLGVRRATGVTIVSVLHEGEQHPNPGPDEVLHPGDTVVVCGPPDAIRRVRDLLRA